MAAYNKGNLPVQIIGFGVEGLLSTDSLGELPDCSHLESSLLGFCRTRVLNNNQPYILDLEVFKKVEMYGAIFRVNLSKEDALALAKHINEQYEV